MCIGDAMQAVHGILVEHEDQLAPFRLNIEQMGNGQMVLIEECLYCYIFKWSNQYYRGLRVNA